MPHPRVPSRPDLQQAVWEREMRRLALFTRLLASLLLALLARAVISGLDLASGMAVIIAAVLLGASLYLGYVGHRQHSTEERTRSRRRAG